ncbi:hypothetical protein SFR_4466 [Streptomyces sp. FR-008]|nr:hypothetical protein SFR_4466 [Streptomyces sp. FR-008]
MTPPPGRPRQPAGDRLVRTRRPGVPRDGGARPSRVRPVQPW